MKVLTLGAPAVLEACPMNECIEEMARAFAGLAEGSIQAPARARLAGEKGDILVMSSLAKRKRQEAAVKVVSIFPENRGLAPTVSAEVLLLDGESGELKGMVEGRTLTAIRTGAVSGLSCRYLARKDSRSLGIIGAGGQALQQVSGVTTALPDIAEVRVFSRTPSRSKALAQECKAALGVDARPEERVQGVVRGSDVLVTATTSKTPVFDGREVAQGTHVIAIGSYRPDVREVDSSLVSRASIFVDSKPAAMEEAGDILIPIKEGNLSKDPVRADLAELVTGKKKGRLSRTDVTFFKSVGLALEDNAAGWLAYRNAERLGIGAWSEI